MRKKTNSELNRISEAEFKETNKSPVLIILDNVRSLNNVGSVFRTADAFHLEALFLCGITGKPPDREIRKTALGATETVQWRYFQSTAEAIAEAKAAGFLLCAVEQTEGAQCLDQYYPAPDSKIALILGNEINGVDQEVINKCDKVIEIPQLGTKHSLNIAVCAGIVVWDLLVKLKVLAPRSA
ncbi:MAG: TrmH family RNA methyltransferase [Bacteroidia bacterium]